MSQRRVRYLPLLLILVASVVLGQDGTVLETIADVPSHGRLALVKASEARQNSEFEQAVTILQEFLAAYPQEDHYLVRYHLANALVRAERVADAVAQYEAAVALEPRHADSWLSLGQASFETGGYHRAGEALERAFAASPEPRADWLYYAGVAYLQDEDPAEAGRVLRALCDGSHGRPTLDWFRALIAAESRVGDRARGDKAVAAMLKLYPDDPAAWNLKTQHALQYEDYRTAAVGLTVKGYLETLRPDELIHLGDILSAADAPGWAAQKYRSALGANPASADYERLVRALLAAHEPTRALTVLEDALSRAPSFELWNMKGYVHYEREEYELALAAFGRCLELNPGYERAHTLMGFCAIELGRFADARGYLDLALESDTERTTAAGLLRDLQRWQDEAEE